MVNRGTPARQRDPFEFPLSAQRSSFPCIRRHHPLSRAEAPVRSRLHIMFQDTPGATLSNMSLV